MRPLFRQLILTPAVALAMLAICNASLAATASQEVVDARQETQIWTTYALSPYLRANDLKVSVKNGKATLTGKVDEDVNKDLAKQIALGVEGVKEVDNQIQVEADYKPASRTRGYGDVIGDASITAAIKSKLLWSKPTASQSINVETNDGKVTLSGTVNSEAKELAGRLAEGTHGVASVTNNLRVGNTPGTSTAGSSTQDAGNLISDSWITTKVKSTFLYSRNVAGSAIDVNTTGGVVTLKGKLDSGVERALAIELAQNIRGVKSVQSTELTSKVQ